MPELDSADPFVASDEGLRPDPTFWDPPARPRRRTGRRPGIAERVVAAVPSRDARTAVAAVVAVLIVTTLLVSYRASVQPGSPPGTVSPPAATARRTRSASPTPRHVVVHVAGAVARPGVVSLPGGSRVIDAIDTAGGALAIANLDAINLAARLRDGQQILVPPTGSASRTATPTSTVPSPSPAPNG